MFRRERTSGILPRFVPLTALLFYSYPLFVAVLSFFVDKINFSGVMLAFGAAFIYSFYIILGNRVIKNLPPMIIRLFSRGALCRYGETGDSCCGEGRGGMRVKVFFLRNTKGKRKPMVQ
jgi:hypothetical protein